MIKSTPIASAMLAGSLSFKPKSMREVNKPATNESGRNANSDSDKHHDG